MYSTALLATDKLWLRKNMKLSFVQKHTNPWEGKRKANSVRLPMSVFHLGFTLWSDKPL